MYSVHIWLRKREGMSVEEFRDYWLNTHAPISRDGYEHLSGYAVRVVTGVPKGAADPPYDGVAELTWENRDDFVTDMRSDAARAGTEDLANFTEAFGLAFVEAHTVK